MRKKFVSSTLALGLVAALMVTLLGAPVSAQEGPALQPEEIFTFDAGAPVKEEFEWTAEPPVLTDEQKASLEYWAANTNLAGPQRDLADTVPAAGPIPGTESTGGERVKSGQPLAPGDAQQFKFSQFGSSIPGGYKSNIMESSIGGNARRYVYTGNWFAARTLDKGSTWTFVDPYSGFADFCCDQVVQFDSPRATWLWLRMGVPGWVGGNYENVFKLSVARDTPISWWTYTIEPMTINSGWTNQWWDYPHMQLTDRYMFLSWNMFDSAGYWTRSVMLAIDLDSLAVAGNFVGWYYSTSSWFTFLPVSGANHDMWWASNIPASGTWNNRLGLWFYNADTGGVGFAEKTVTAWTATNRGSMHCGSPNWLARGDQRLLAGARYVNAQSGFADSRAVGRKVIAWWWDVAEGGGFSYPYIESAAFYEDNLAQLPGYIGRPYVYGSWCFAYPSAAVNDREDVALVFNFSKSDPGYHMPFFGFGLNDDYVSFAPPGWTVYAVAASKAGPSDNVWGDYTTVRTFQPTKYAWVGVGHIIPTTSNCTYCSAPIYVAFGRARDFWSWAQF